MHKKFVDDVSGCGKSMARKNCFVATNSPDAAERTADAEAKEEGILRWRKGD
jgi:hypothetical protein